MRPRQAWCITRRDFCRRNSMYVTLSM
jgi:hypothetical protein